MTSFEECVLFIDLTSNEILTDEVIKVKSPGGINIRRTRNNVYK